jgi:hypothetical protein
MISGAIELPNMRPVFSGTDLKSVPESPEEENFIVKVL